MYCRWHVGSCCLLIGMRRSCSSVHLRLPPLLQGKPYALFGTCLGAIVAYEVAQRVADRKHAPMPLALFPAAVSPPHLYALAVMKLYVQRAVGELWVFALFARPCFVAFLECSSEPESSQMHGVCLHPFG